MGKKRALRDRTRLCLAEDLVIAILISQGQKPKDYDPDNITQAANEMLATYTGKRMVRKVEKILKGLVF